MIYDTDNMDLKTLIKLAEQKAAGESDRHLTIMKFTTEWKVMTGTPCLDSGSGRDQIGSLKGYESLEEALSALILGLP